MANDPRLRRDGTQFETISDAARALGVTPACIHWHLRRHGHINRVGNGNKGNTKKYLWQGREYSGCADVAAAAGKSVATVHHHLKTYGSLDLLTGPGRRTVARYVWRGKEYLGQKAVADAAGLTPNAVSQHLQKYGTLDRLGEWDPCIEVTVDWRSWPSVKEFAKAVGKSRSRVDAVISSGNIDLMRRWVADAELLPPAPPPQPIAPPAADMAEATFGCITARQCADGEVRLVRMGSVGRHRTATAMFWLKSQVDAALDGAAMRGSQDEIRALRWARERLADG